MNDHFRIARVRARQVLDSRAAPTVEADVLLRGGAVGRAAVPSGVSTGRHEALELRDHESPMWAGRGVVRAVVHAEAVFGMAVQDLDARDQAGIDAALQEADGTDGFRRLGANAALAVSLATARAVAAAHHEPLYRRLAQLAGTTPRLPLPMVNMLSGGAHAGGNLDLQDVLVVPVGAQQYADGLEMIVRVYWTLRALLVAAGHPPLVGDEGGFGPSLGANEEALALVERAIEGAGLRPGIDMALALDVAATGFYRDGFYHLAHDAPGAGVVRLDTGGMIALVERWCGAYPIVSIEDPLAEDDWDGWARLMRQLGGRQQLLGDDLFTTDSRRVQLGIERGAANAVLLKVNQVGTLTAALQALALCNEHGLRVVVSARSGETEDDWLADLAVGSGAGQIKVGSVARSERLAKYNRLLRIAEEADGTIAYGVDGWHPHPASKTVH